MPGRGLLQRRVAVFLRGSDARQRATFAALDWWYRLALWPFRRRRHQGQPIERGELLAKRDEFNAAAERYFERFPHPDFLRRKPYSSLASLPTLLIDAGVVIRALQLAPGDTVLELGAGSCWFSHMLNLSGVRTLAVDVSPTALALGRQLFEQDRRTDWTLRPEFLSYDGRRLPVADETCDRAVVLDAFHHIPNQRDLLEELHRILRADGLVVMSEPGLGHAGTAHSENEVAHWGVLENELVIEDVAALARACGFVEAAVIASSAQLHQEIEPRDLGSFMGGRGFSRFWSAFCVALESHHYLVLRKRPHERTTRGPGRLRAGFRRAGHQRVACPEDVAATIRLTVANEGDTSWIGGEGPTAGWTRIGAHLYRRRADQLELLDFDWWRGALPDRVAPGQEVALDVVLPSIAAAGSYTVVFDLVIEGVTWFEMMGGRSMALDVEVERRE